MDDLKDLYRFIATKDQRDYLKKNTPYALDAAIPNLNLLSYMDGPNTYGHVSRDNPNNIMINRYANLREAPHVLPHEYEHVLQNNVDNRYPQGYDGSVIAEIAKRKGISYDMAKLALISSLKNAGSDTGVKSKLKELGGLEGNYNGSLGGGQFSLREQWGDLSALESMAKKDYTTDPSILKSMFNNDPDIAAVYKGATGLRTNRLDAKDLAPMTPEKKMAPMKKEAAPQSNWDILKGILGL